MRIQTFSCIDCGSAVRVWIKKAADYRCDSCRKAYRTPHPIRRPKKNKNAQKKIPTVNFYYSDAWRQLRYRVFKKYGRQCMVCGATGKLHIDHIKPRSKFPKLELEMSNLQVLCEDCNMGKLNLDDTDWRPKEPTKVWVRRKE